MVSGTCTDFLRQTEDIEEFFGINDDIGRLLTDRKKALKQWHNYFKEISTMKFPHPAIASGHGPVHKITVEKTEATLKRMEPCEATGPDDSAVID
ncbi:unnamed protein product [Heligmosomoides polygyrus]|uniref:DUF4160 domain-containing protein n=1 Tax=Heligmosomoides polygyrus TaxID=6339 RepID=A0A183FKX2_HELPZ|nr:unnamed protein product [Heligmosomoides polygyrus]